MSRYIDADALQRRICGAKCGCEHEDCGCEGDCAFDHFIFHAPTVDVVPRAEVEKIIEEVKKKAEVYFWHHDSVSTSWFIEFCDELKKKYVEGAK